MSAPLGVDDTKRMVDSEISADQVAEGRHYLIELDRKQNQLREARRKLLKTRPDADGDIWMLCSASTFVSCELSHKDTVKYLDWQLHENELAIEAARTDLMEKVTELAMLEGPDSALAHLHEGFGLTAHNKKQLGANAED